MEMSLPEFNFGQALAKDLRTLRWPVPDGEGSLADQREPLPDDLDSYELLWAELATESRTWDGGFHRRPFLESEYLPFGDEDNVWDDFADNSAEAYGSDLGSLKPLAY